MRPQRKHGEKGVCLTLSSHPSLLHHTFFLTIMTIKYLLQAGLLVCLGGVVVINTILGTNPQGLLAAFCREQIGQAP